MTQRLMLCVTLCLVALQPLQAAQPAACDTPSYDWYTHSADELRSIAASCDSEQFAELNFHRAYYKDLIEEANAASDLIDYSRSSSRSYFNVYVTYIVLVEQIAPLYFPAAAEQLEFLNSEYEVNNEIAELWLRGYENLAARLDKLHSDY